MGIWSQVVGAAAQGASAALGAFGDVFSKGLDDTGNLGPNEGQERAPGGSQADTAANAPMVTQPAEAHPMSLMWDPYTVMEQLGYKERPSAITYGTLNAMFYRSPVVAAVIKTRVDQMAAFAKPRQDRYGIGYIVRMRDKDERPTAADKKFIKQAMSTIARTGVTIHPRGRDTFETYIRKVGYDTLKYDQDTTEIVHNRLGQPAEFYAVDAASIRLADTARLYMDENIKDEVRYVQIYDNAIIAQYTQDEMIFGVRNPNTDLRVNGYGISELEMMLSAVTSLLYSMDYNSRFFQQGTMAKGLLNIKGTMPEIQLAKFKRGWYSMVTSAQNAWRTPILNNKDGVEWVNMQSNNRDMEFNAWMDFLIKVVCSFYAMDPSEINFRYGNTGQTNTMTEENNRDKVTESRERGLRPLLHHIAGNLNRHFLWPINESFELEFVGLDSDTPDEVADLNKKRVSSIMTINECRAEEDKPPLPGGMGDIILDPNFVQHLASQQQADMQKQQMAQQAAQGGPDDAGDASDFGGGDTDDEDDEDDLDATNDDAEQATKSRRPKRPTASKSTLRKSRSRVHIDLTV